MNPTFDDRDAALRTEREALWNTHEGPRVGDFVKMPGGELRRFTYHWGDSIQTTCSLYPAHGSFYFGNGYVSYSGGLDLAIPLARIRTTGEQRDGRFWFFHHDFQRAHNGVHFTIPCRVFEVTAQQRQSARWQDR